MKNRIWKSLQGHRKFFEAALLVVCCNNTSILHRFQDITTFTVYMTACNIKKSFIWATYTFQSVYEYILANRCYLFGALRFTKVSNTWSDFQRHQGHSYWCRLTDHIYGFQVPEKRIFVNNWSSRPDAIPVTSLKRTWRELWPRKITHLPHPFVIHQRSAAQDLLHPLHRLYSARSTQ